jgi:hypothetical protein
LPTAPGGRLTTCELKDEKLDELDEDELAEDEEDEVVFDLNKIFKTTKGR